MFKKLSLVLILMVTLVAALSGCGTAEPETADVIVTEDAVIAISGAVKNTAGWSADQLRAMEIVDVDYTNKDGEVTTYTGIPIVALLEAAGIEEGAQTVTLVAADDYAAEVSLAELQACPNCIIGFDGDSYRVVMPDFPSNLQVKDIVRIEVE